ncbi:MAG TPA: peptidase [Allosphingosinicella sp.]|uniref:peptidase n=1 Tax=Allosphingosinicella sp. TaxID=2823234 RepID=UPI002ED9AEE1
MTYCIGFLLDEGLIMMADTRTNAGVDNFSSFKKLHTLVDTADRQIFACTSGSLSMSQAVISLLREGLPSSGDVDMVRTLSGAATMFRAAQLVGEAVQIASRTVGAALASVNIGSSVSLLLGGRIGKAPPALYLVYSAGNFIECKTEVPFLQIGETKYGKPILDRRVRMETPLDEAVKVGFLSYDSAMRSNLGVSRPIDVLVMPRDKKRPLIQVRVEEDDEYFNALSREWAALLSEATQRIPNPPFMAEPE